MKTITLVTTLLDAERYPAKAVAALYGQRWEIETNIKHLKRPCACKSSTASRSSASKKEAAMFGLAYNLVRLVMLEALRRQKVLLSPISFIHALRRLRTAIPDTPLGKLVFNRTVPAVLSHGPSNAGRKNTAA
jgi:IS4 transposase